MALLAAQMLGRSYCIVCFQLPLLNPRSVVQHWFLFEFFPAALDQTRFKAGGYCEVCKMAINYIDGILEKNATEEQIKEAVRKVCSFLPDSFQTEVRSCTFLDCVTFTHPQVTALY